MVSLGQPSERLLVGFPDVATALSRSGIIEEYVGKGIKTRIYINFGEGGGLYRVERDEDHKKYALRLDTYMRNRIPIYWDPTITEETWVIDGLFYRGREVTAIKEDFIPFRRYGFFNIRQGTVIMTQKLSTFPPDLDLIVRLKTDTSRGGLPVFLTTQMLEAGIREGDQLKVAYVTNYSGEGIRTFYAPSQLFFEGLAIEIIERPDTGVSDYRTVREAADRLLSSLSSEKTPFRSERDRKNAEFIKVRNTVKLLRDEGFFVEGSDEAYIRKKVSLLLDSL